MTTKSFILSLLVALVGCAQIPPGVRSMPDPLSAAEHVTLGDSYLAQDRAAARSQYQAALRQEKNCVPALMALGNMAFEEHQWMAARQDFQQILKRAPNDAGAVNNLAMVDLAEDKHLNEAKRSLDQALMTGGPLTPYLWDTLANIAIRQARLTDAQQAIDRARSLAPHDSPAFAAHLKETQDKLNALAQHPDKLSPPKR